MEFKLVFLAEAMFHSALSRVGGTDKQRGTGRVSGQSANTGWGLSLNICSVFPVARNMIKSSRTAQNSSFHSVTITRREYEGNDLQVLVYQYCVPSDFCIFHPISFAHARLLNSVMAMLICVLSSVTYRRSTPLISCAAEPMPLTAQ